MNDEQLETLASACGLYDVRKAAAAYAREVLAASKPAVPVDAQTECATLSDWRDRCAALVDIYDDACNNAPEDRSYVDGAFKDEIGQARAALQAVPAADATTPGMAEGWIAFSDRLPPTKDNGRGDTARQKVLVTNNILARDAFGNPSHVWLGSPFIDNETGEWRVYEGGRYLTHWMNPFPVAASTGDQAEEKAE